MIIARLLQFRRRPRIRMQCSRTGLVPKSALG